MTPGPGALRKQMPSLAHVCSPGREWRLRSGLVVKTRGLDVSCSCCTPGASDPARGVERGGTGAGNARCQIQPRKPLSGSAQSCPTAGTRPQHPAPLPSRPALPTGGCGAGGASLPEAGPGWSRAATRLAPSRAVSATAHSCRARLCLPDSCWDLTLSIRRCQETQRACRQPAR